VRDIGDARIAIEEAQSSAAKSSGLDSTFRKSC